MNVSEKPIRVAVIGGGCAALTTAFELTHPKHQGRYQVTVYQMGWRLGGKGASSRGIADRVEEHGLHLWMGFYENAFRLMRECYAERHRLFPQSRFASWQDAFKPAPDIGVMDRTPEGWDLWMAHFPPSPGQPGDPDGTPFTVISYLRQSVRLVAELLRSAAMKSNASNEPPPDFTRSGFFAGRQLDAASVLNTLLRYGQLATSAALIEASQFLIQTIGEFFPQALKEGALPLLQILEVLSRVAQRQLEFLIAGDTELRRIWLVIDLILAIIRGSVRSGLAFDPRGFDAINDYDWRQWLRLHGASAQSLDSGFMRGIYDLVFAFEDGDVQRPRLAAGVALRGAMRMFFTYRGSLFWRMSSGMGDIVFAPLYQVLKQRGVKFEFFHRLRNVGLSRDEPEPPYVQTLEFDVQARVRDGGEYDPLIDVHGVPCWPPHPDYGQLVKGSRMAREEWAFEAAWETRCDRSRTLHAGRDFDFVVLGVSIGAIPDVAKELIERSASWRNMVRHIKTVPTQAFQVWLKQHAKDLGWKRPQSTLSGFVEPFDTWADMSHLIPEESWTDTVQSIAYFCSVLPDGDKPEEGSAIRDRASRETVRSNAIRFLERDIGTLWPNAKADGAFRWDLLAAEDHLHLIEKPVADSSRFDTQFWTANVHPSDRYVQSLPGSIIYRVSPLELTFDNLTIAGDWTASGLDSGCIESAVMSGLLAAHAIALEPPLHEIVGYDHP